MYFKMLPDVDYLKYSTNPYQGELIRVKNLFLRSIFSKFASRFTTIFDEYIIKDGDRPDTLAYNLYDNSYYDWVIIICNERLINFYDEWPKQSIALEQFVFSKYGSKAYDIHHYETLEIKDSYGNIVLQSGLKVGTGFSFTYTENNVTFVKSGNQVLMPITNFDYEFNENEKKRKIQLLKPQYLTLFENEIKRLSTYNTSAPNVLSQTLKTTKNDILPTI